MLMARYLSAFASIRNAQSGSCKPPDATRHALINRLDHRQLTLTYPAKLNQQQALYKWPLKRVCL